MPHWPNNIWTTPPGDPLERMAVLLEALGNPQEKLPPVIHVAGTNGKGSTIAILRAIFEAAGLKAHIYSSPHIRNFRERITISGETIGETALFELLERCRAANEEQPITFFEATTAAALLAFSEAPADIVLLETGMGGLHDPTNVIAQPRLSIITTISFDHMESLGQTLGEIAEQKAGILKSETPAIISFQPEEALETLNKKAETINAPLMSYGTHWAVQKSVDGFFYADAYGQVDFPSPALLGPHQLINAGNAIAAISALDEFDISAEQIAAGLRWVQWPGRLEHITDGPLNTILPNDWELWFDGGHNIAAGLMLAIQAEEAWSDKPLHVIFGTTRGKPVGPILQPLFARAETMTAVPVLAEPKCYTPAEIVDQADDMNIRVHSTDCVEDAIHTIIQHSEQPARILIFGSLYLRLEVVNYND